MKKGLILILACTLILACFSFIISAQPPFAEEGLFQNGFTIKYPPVTTLEQGKDFTLNFHIFNSSDGFPIDNSSTQCIIHFYNESGYQIIESIVPHAPDTSITNEWEILIKGGNISNVGNYYYNFQCNSSIQGGFSSVLLEVTSNGQEASYNYLIAMVVLIITFLGFGILIYLDKSKMEDEKYWNKMVMRWRDKNYLRFSATALWYNIKKNSYVLHYLIGLIISVMLYDITLVYNLSIAPVFKILMGLYIFGALLVVIVFFGTVQEWLKEWQENLSKINWGELTNG